MSVYSYKRYKISLSTNSSKTQGLVPGDIVRRQYIDHQLAKNADGTYSGSTVGTIYSLMCVLETGIDLVSKTDKDGNIIVDEQGNIVKEQSQWFIGALLEGQATPPRQGELLDFVRVTNLFDLNRSGALYLTASDDSAPYMDVVDGIARNQSLGWPESMVVNPSIRRDYQYCLEGEAVGEFFPTRGENSRAVRISRTESLSAFMGLRQEFYRTVENPDMVLVSYKAKAKKDTSVNASVSLKYTNNTETDGRVEVSYDDKCKYFLHSFIVENSGRHIRQVEFDFSSMNVGDELEISDLNIILLSSISNYSESSRVRIGKLDGVVDPVFGRLDGYGGYIQNLFASRSAHISGTLTAGDANGFGSSFYAGKIHKNLLLDSLTVETLNPVEYDNVFGNPTGLGNTLKIANTTTLVVQTNEWLYPIDKESPIGKTHTFSFWVYSQKPCEISLLQNGYSIGSVYVNSAQTDQWLRLSRSFILSGLTADRRQDKLLITVNPVFVDGQAGELWFAAPQFESGDYATQYQPTDGVLNDTDEYGAWFNRGGIGGTIQNPLLRLNDGGKGAISTRPNSQGVPSFSLNQDGSGHIAHGNIQWAENGDTVLSENVKVAWKNLSEDVQSEMSQSSVKITGADTFLLLGDGGGDNPKASPTSITLSLELTNINNAACNRTWYWRHGYEWVKFPEGIDNLDTLTLFPTNISPDYWQDTNSVTVKGVVSVGDKEYADTFTVRKQLIAGYTVVITSSNGLSFSNSDCQTTLTANVYYQGRLIPADYCSEHFQFKWHKTDTVNGVVVADDSFWNNGLDRTAQSLVLAYDLVGADSFSCEVSVPESFSFGFPITL